MLHPFLNPLCQWVVDGVVAGRYGRLATSLLKTMRHSWRARQRNDAQWLLPEARLRSVVGAGLVVSADLAEGQQQKRTVRWRLERWRDFGNGAPPPLWYVAGANPQ